MHYTGTVQGVGFRFTARGLAQRFVVTGYVRNLPDGTVEVVACGEESEVEAYFGALGNRMADYISDRSRQVLPAEHFDTFDIRF